MNQELISEINRLCPQDQGIFFQPSFIPVDVKELVVYTRYKTGGSEGGDCWGSESRSFSEELPKDKLKVLDLVLEHLAPNITYLQYKKIEAMIRTNEEREREYYGNSTDWKVEYIVLSELEAFLNAC